LHQNYLRRKASGKAAEEYERTTEKKKAAMDAKKNALRAEDIAKGVFAPVSRLPKVEPKKAAQAACPYGRKPARVQRSPSESPRRQLAATR